MELIGALRTGIARPFVSVGAMGKNGWVEVRFDRVDQEALERLIEAASAAAQHAHRRSQPKRPSAARRSRSKA
jgi:hypothetical protein